MSIQRYKLQELRARHGLKQADVAKDLGVATATYSNWERDITNVDISKLSRIAEYFDVSVSEIFLPGIENIVPNSLSEEES